MDNSVKLCFSFFLCLLVHIWAGWIAQSQSILRIVVVDGDGRITFPGSGFSLLLLLAPVIQPDN